MSSSLEPLLTKASKSSALKSASIGPSKSLSSFENPRLEKRMICVGIIVNLTHFSLTLCNSFLFIL